MARSPLGQGTTRFTAEALGNDSVSAVIALVAIPVYVLASPLMPEVGRKMTGMAETQQEQAGVLTGQSLPPGYGSVNPFVAVRGPGGAPAFIDFAVRVFDARETLAAHTVDVDDLLIHAEVRIGDSTVMLCDAKPQWPFMPALLQVYVADAGAVLERAVANGAAVITEPTDFYGDQRLARLLDPWHNVWWLFEYGPSSAAPSQGPDELPRWRLDPSVPPSYIHRTIDEALTTLREPGATA